MSRTLQNAVQTKEVRSLGTVRLSPVKAQLDSRTESNPTNGVENSDLIRLGSIVESALLAAHVKKGVAADVIGIDQTQMMRQIKLGTFDLRQCSAAGEAFLAAFGLGLVEAYGAARKSKKQIALDRLPELLALMLAAVQED